jgi:hypothetical protein
MKLFPIFLLLVVTQWPQRRKKFYVLFGCRACSGVTVMGHISSSTAFEHRRPTPSRWGAEMEVNFKPYKRCHKLHLMALRAALTAGP